MQTIIVAPREELKEVVKAFWYAVPSHVATSRSTYKILPDGAPGIIIQHYNGNSALFDMNDQLKPVAFFYGQSTTPTINYTAGCSFIGVSLQPTAFARLFAHDASLLTNNIADAANFFPAAFNNCLLNASPSDAIQHLSDELYKRLLRSKQSVIIDESVKMITQARENVNSTVLSAYFNISRRQFQRKFKEEVGVCPDTYQRIIRFQKAIRLLSTGMYDKLSDVGYALDYADQSHFGREFSSFSGYTPSAFLKTTTMQQYFPQSNCSSFETLRIVEN